MTDAAKTESTAPRLRLLGGAEMLGPPLIHWSNERRFRLAAYLALRGDWVSRNQLATLFWPNRAQDVARSNLRKLLLEVRALDLPGLESDRDGLLWRVASDVADFLTAVARGDTAAILSLYRGQVLHGLEGGDSEAFTAWLASERQRLHALWRDAVMTELPRRDSAGALQLARLLLDDDPLDEDAMVAALAAQHALGDDRGAALSFRGYAERLMEDLGIEPSTRVRAAASQAASPTHQRAKPTASGTEGAATAEAPALTALSFVGREHDIRELASLLADPACRVLTVTGPGGMGKSRLVKQALRRLEPNYADGATWIALDDLTGANQVAPRVAAELALSLVPGQDPVEQVAIQLATNHRLLVLDNAEHLAGLPAVIRRWIKVAPRLQVLCTSRTKLGIDAEALLPLAGLTVSPPGALAGDAGTSDAVQLFVAHARAAHPSFDIGRQTPLVAQLVHSVGGLPLAIILSASWVRLLPLPELVNDLAQSLRMLESASDGEERAEHRSMVATFEGSWRLLVPAEQRALAALSVFAGAFSRVAAMAVAGTPVLMLSSLHDRSLLQVEVGADDAARFRLHPLLRHFARSKMRAVDERRNLQFRHARHFAQWLSDTEQALRGARQPEALAAVERQLSDCQAAWAYAVEHHDMPFIERASLSLMYYYEARGRRTDGIALFAAAERALENDAGAGAGALAMLARALSTLRYRSGEMALTIDTATRGIGLARRVGARPALKGCLLNLGLAQYQHGHLAAARQSFEEGLALARADHDPGIGAFVTSLAMVEQEIGNHAAAEMHYREALRINRELRNPRGMLTALNNLALLLLEGNRAADALPMYEDGLRLCAEHGIEVMRANFLFGLGGARLALGQLPVARDLTQDALVAARGGGEPHVAVEAQMQLARIALAASDVIEATQLAQQALQQAVQLENLLVLLNAVQCIADCRARAGDARGALALWLFIAAHPQTGGSQRERVQHLADTAGVSSADRAWAEEQAQHYELRNLARALAEPANGDAAVAA